MRTPTDTFWSYQWGPRTVSAPAAWDVTTGASDVVIAILDTGVTPGPEFDGKLLAGIDFVNGDADPADDDAKRHGPAVRSEEHTSALQSLMRITYAVFCLTKKT